MRKAKVYIALLHYPMYNKRMDIITTSVTNLDLHDIARAARTYDVEKFYVVHPSPNQQNLIKDIVAYWQEGYGGDYNTDRKEAFKRLYICSDLKQVIEYITGHEGQAPITVATDARDYGNSVTYRNLKDIMYNEEKIFLILFGTGWGIGKELIMNCDYILEPIEPNRSYNHLSVRSAVTIILDRLLGAYWF
ncbi:MAG: RNA methyltransferase [Syntrophomonadaceae bacterium]|nr:RNA methyltransferase [Syntrophomonadaceae bacterium]